VTQKLSQIRPMTEEEQRALMRQLADQQRRLQAAAAGATPVAQQEATGEEREGFDEANPQTWGNPGRNDSCPCGSGKKFKHCHGKLT